MRPLLSAPSCGPFPRTQLRSLLMGARARTKVWGYRQRYPACSHQRRCGWLPPSAHLNRPVLALLIRGSKDHMVEDCGGRHGGWPCQLQPNCHLIDDCARATKSPRHAEFSSMQLSSVELTRCNTVVVSLSFGHHHDARLLQEESLQAARRHSSAVVEVHGAPLERTRGTDCE